MRYMLQFFEDAGHFAKRNDPEEAGNYWAGWSAYASALSNAECFVSGAGLETPSTATVLTIRGDDRQVQDGPHADAKEQLGGFFVIDVESLDEALEWAARSPSAHYGSVEIRPVLPPPAN